MIVEFPDEQLPELKQLLNRALNTWDRAPKWAWELDAKVSKLLGEVPLENHNGNDGS